MLLRVAKIRITELLRQKDAKVCKEYSQEKFLFGRNALEKMNRQTNEMNVEVATAAQESRVCPQFLYSFDAFCYRMAV
jgi:hypothetical protein